MLDVHTVLGVLCCQLQEENLIFSDVPALIDCVVSKLEFLKTNDGQGLKQMKASIEVKDDKAFYKGDELRYFSEQAGQQFQSVREQYMCDVTKNIKKRIPKSDSKIMTSLGQLLEPSAVNVASTDKTDKALEILVEHYGSEKL